jgi:hypothetical protein
MDKKFKKVAGAIGIIGVSFGLGALAHGIMTPEKIQYNTVYVDKEVPVEKIVTIEKEVPVEKIVEVSDGKLDLVLQEIYDNEGSVEYLTDDLKDSEVSLIADRIILVNDFKTLAVSEVRKNLFDELDGETFGSVTFDDKDMERLRINDDANEIIISDIDFEDKDADLEVSGTFDQDDIRYKYTATVSFKDGEVDEIDSIVIELA